MTVSIVVFVGLPPTYVRTPVQDCCDVNKASHLFFSVLSFRNSTNYKSSHSIVICSQFLSHHFPGLLDIRLLSVNTVSTIIHAFFFYRTWPRPHAYLTTGTYACCIVHSLVPPTINDCRSHSADFFTVSTVSTPSVHWIYCCCTATIIALFQGHTLFLVNSTATTATCLRSFCMFASVLHCLL